MSVQSIDVTEGQDEIVVEPEVGPQPRNHGHTLVWVVLPLAVLAMTLGVGYLKWQTSSVSSSQGAAAQAVLAATEGAGAMLSYRADHAQQDLTAATERMTGDFRNEYTTLINDLVIPGAEQKRISAVATVPAAALLSADADHAQVLVYVNQTTTVGAEPPSDTRSSARVDLEKVGDRWLISGFEPL